MRPSHWYSEGELLEVEGYQLFVRTTGQGAPLIALHGMPGSSWMWHKLAPSLEEDWRLITPDLLGFGYSEKPPDERYSVVSQADRVETLVREWELDGFHLMGHGYGAMIAAELLARAQGRERENIPGPDPRSLFLINPPLFPEIMGVPATESWLAGRLGGLLRWAGTRNLFWKYLNQISGPYSRPTPAEVAHLWRLMNRNQGRWIWPELAKWSKELHRRGNRWSKAVKESERPVHIVAGPEDPIAGHRMESAFRRTLPDHPRTLIGKLGHAPHFEGHDKLLEAIEEFTDEVRNAH